MRRMKRTPAEKACAQYTGYPVKEPMELVDFLTVKMPDAGRTKLKSLPSKRIILADNVVTTQFNPPLRPDTKMPISKDRNKKEFRHPLLKVVYEDAYIVAVGKEEGLLSAGTDRQKERTAQYILSEYVERPGCGNRIPVIHCLDRDTPRLMMSARGEETQRALRNHWHDIATDRRYVVVITGEIEKDSDTVVSWLIDCTLHVSSSSYDDGGSKSTTHYRTIKRANGHSLVELRLKTGRKSQIRVHMQDLGHSLIGDGRYGIDGSPNPLGHLALYAFKLCFCHPITDQLMKFEAPCPSAFKKLLLRK